MGKILGLWSEAAKYGWGSWTEDEWAWFAVHAFPWADLSHVPEHEGMDWVTSLVTHVHEGLTGGKYEAKERSYWAGPWEQRYSKTYLHDASLFQVGKDQWRVCCFWHEGYGYGGDFGPAEA